MRVPGGSFAPPLDGSLVEHLPDHVEREVADDGHVFGMIQKPIPPSRKIQPASRSARNQATWAVTDYHMLL